MALTPGKRTHSIGPLGKRGAFWSPCGPWRPTLVRPSIEWGVLAAFAFWLHKAVEIVEFGPLTEALRRELEGDEQDPFDARGITMHFQPKDRHVGLRDDAGRRVASTGIVLVEVEVDRERFPVVGLGGVIVNAQHRGRGLGRQVGAGRRSKKRQSLVPHSRSSFVTRIGLGFTASSASRPSMQRWLSGNPRATRRCRSRPCGGPYMASGNGHGAASSSTACPSELYGE